MPTRDDHVIDIQFAATVEVARTITSWKTVEALAPLHILVPEVVRERFDYDQTPGLHVAFVRIARLNPAWTIPNESKYGGCRSWVNLPGLPESFQLKPVLTDKVYEERFTEFLEIVKTDKMAGSSSSSSGLG